MNIKDDKNKLDMVLALARIHSTQADIDNIQGALNSLNNRLNKFPQVKYTNEKGSSINSMVIEMYEELKEARENISILERGLRQMNSFPDYIIPSYSEDTEPNL